MFFSKIGQSKYLIITNLVIVAYSNILRVYIVPVFYFEFNLWLAVVFLVAINACKYDKCLIKITD